MDLISRQGMAKAAILIVILSLLSKFLGFFREVIFARYFGASSEMDAFVIAGMVPTVLGTVIRACIITAFIPVYNSYLAKNDQENAQKVANLTFVGLTGVALLLSGLVFIFASNVVHLVAPGFPVEVHNLTVNLMQVMLPILILFSLLGFVNSIQQAHNIFVYPALIGLPANIIIILTVLVFAKNFGIYAAAAGSVLAILAQVLIQVPGLKKCGYSPALSFEFNHPGIRRIIYLILPILLGTAASNANILVDRIIASTFDSGSIAALNYAYKITTAFVSLFIVSIATVTFPSLSKYVANNNMQTYIETLNFSIRVIVFLTIPVMTVLLFFNFPIVEILLQRGAFDYNAAKATSYALFYFSWGLLGMSLIDILNRAFYAAQDTKVPTVVNIGVVTVNVVLNLILPRYLGFSGLALSTAIAINIGVLLMFVCLRLKVGQIGGKKIFISLAKVISASGIMLGVIYVVFYALNGQPSALSPKLGLILSLGLGGIMYFIAAWKLRCEEFLKGVAMIKQKLPFFKDKTVTQN